MPTELEHREDEAVMADFEPTTRDDSTAPGDFQFLLFNSEFLTFHGKKLMKQVSDD
jgi:hypothetical protein